MDPSTNTRVDLIKLMTGERLLRMNDLSSGLVLEKTLDPRQPLVRQKEQLFSIFEAALARARVVAAGARKTSAQDSLGERSRTL